MISWEYLSFCQVISPSLDVVPVLTASCFRYCLLAVSTSSATDVIPGTSYLDIVRTISTEWDTIDTMYRTVHQYNVQCTVCSVIFYNKQCKDCVRTCIEYNSEYKLYSP